MTQTPGSHFTQPTVGGDTNTWADALNLNWLLADRQANSVVFVSIPDANVTLVADGTTGDQSIYAAYQFTGALTATRTVILPSNVKIGFASNGTTGGQSILLTAGATALTLAPDNSRVRFEVDASNNVISPLVSSGSFSASGTNKYCHLPGNILLQCGVGTSAGGSFNDLTFPVAFANTSYVVTASVPSVLLSPGTWTIGYGTKTASACQVGVFLNGVAQGGVEFSWVAIGIS